MRRLLFTALLAGCDGDLRFAAPADASVDSNVVAAECTRDEQCTADLRRRCDVASQRCVECGVTSDCDGSEVCDPGTKQCMRACGDGATCSSDTPFCDPRGFCVCTAASCTSGERRLCAPAGRCVECTSDSQCSEGIKKCDLVRGECVD
jgi:hypothetical protein